MNTLKACQLFRRPFTSLNGVSPCQRCIQLQSADEQWSRTNKRKAIKTNVTSKLLLPSMVSFSTKNRLLSNAFKDKLFSVGIRIPQNYTRQQLDIAAKVLLNSVYMKVPYKALRETAGLEDSFMMWLRIVYIHLWFLTCQLNKGGRDGQIMNGTITKLLWEDVNVRLKKFETETKQRINSLDVLKSASNELNVFFIFLDEGLLSSDALLASTLWTLVYSLNSYEAEIWHIENLVHYIRLLSARMQTIDFNTFVLEYEKIDWEFPKSLLDSIEEENQKWPDQESLN